MSEKRMGKKALWTIVIFGIALMIAGIVHWILARHTEGLFYFGLGLILFYLFAMIPNQIIVQKDGIEMRAFLRKKFLPYEEIDHLSWVCSGKLITTSYTGYLHMKKGGKRKLLSRDEASLKLLNEIVMRALAVGHSERAGEIIYLR